MSNLFDFFFSHKGTVINESDSTSEDFMEFIKSHTVEMPDESRMIMIPMEEFEEMASMAEEADLPQESTIQIDEVQEPKTKSDSGQMSRPAPSRSLEIPQDTPPQEESNSNTFTGGELLSVLNELKEMMKRENYKDGIIKNLHKEMERLNGNFFEDIRRPMIKSIIAIHRQMMGRVKALDKNQTDSDADYENLYLELVKNVKFDMTAVGDTLEDEYDLEYFEPSIGDLYNPKEDNAIRVVITENEQQDSVIQEVLYGGFKNTSTDKIFLKANVIVYKFKNIKNYGQ